MTHLINISWFCNLLLSASNDCSHRNENIEELRRNVLIFHHLRQASAELNDIFSVPILFLLAFKFVMIVGTAFAYIYSFITSNDVLENGRYFIGFTCLAECVRTLVILTAADLPINQV